MRAPALITTKGFRDILEIRDLRMPVLSDLHWTKPRALVERRLRLEVVEKLRPDGSVAVPLDTASVAAAIAMLRARGGAECRDLPAALLRQSGHERAVAEAVRAALPDVAVSVSHEILPEIKEYPRTSTTVINAYVQPVVRAYVTALAARLRAMGIEAPLQLMQSNGGLASVEFAAAAPAHIIESGPAAGVVGGAALAAKLDEPRVITFDMGGTTAKAGLVENGEVLRTEALEVGAGVMAGSRLLVGAGYLLKLPAIDLAEVGAGGGSICRLDAAGAPKVGPDSAGAEPGPACYGRGGTPDDHRLQSGAGLSRSRWAGRRRVEARRGRAHAAAIARDLAAPLRLSVEEAAFGMLRLASASMMRAIRAVSVERGRDPRQFALLAFGGNGPLFAAAIATELGSHGLSCRLCRGVQRIRTAGGGYRASCEPKSADAAGRGRCGADCLGARGADGDGRTAAGARWVPARAPRVPAGRFGAIRWAVERNRSAAAGGWRRWRISPNCLGRSTNATTASARPPTNRWN